VVGFVRSTPFAGVPRGPESPLFAIDSRQVAFTAPNAVEANLTGVEAILPEGGGQGEHYFGLAGPSPLGCVPSLVPLRWLWLSTSPLRSPGRFNFDDG
jgi:hypothetical protein